VLTRAKLNETEISVMKLEWESVESTELNATPDVILAAGKTCFFSYFNSELF
jgi:hypothetical protein